MIPVVTPDEMRAIDASASDPVARLIERAGAAVARSAIDLLGGTYGRTVVVIAGTGNNGADGREAAVRLRSRGVRVRVFDAASLPTSLPESDLVIDAAYGTGFRADPSRPWAPPRPDGAPVLAVDIPSGVDGLTGVAGPGVLRADRTVTFQALKPGLLFGDGPRLAGDVEVVDIGLDTSHIRCHLVEGADAAEWWPSRTDTAHKWHTALKVVAGSDAMPGAAELCTASAMRAGSGLVSLSAPGCRPSTRSEVVQQPIAAADFSDEVLGDISRFGALVIGPGLGRHDQTLLAARRCLADALVPVVVDGDAIFAAAQHGEGADRLLGGRQHPTVLTPHDGEFATLTGSPPADDRIAAVRAAATRFGSTILLKGPNTVIASPSASVVGESAGSSAEPVSVLIVDHGDRRLATAGSGDVLAGMLGAALAAGVDPARAAGAAAWLHAECARSSVDEGLVAGDLVDRLPAAIAAMRDQGAGR